MSVVSVYGLGNRHCLPAEQAAHGALTRGPRKPLEHKPKQRLASHQLDFESLQ
jgi:hypothetical protein